MLANIYDWVIRAKLVLSAFMSVIELFGVTGNFSFGITNPYIKG